MKPRRICFVTGTRAEYGLMRSALRRIADHPKLHLQIVVTGMHLDRSRGLGINEIRADGRKIDAIIPWKASTDSQSKTAIETGKAMAAMAAAFETLESDVVLITGDRVEVFAAASAAHISGKILAHVHGGDRALGLVDDSLRHAITKLSHIHFPATIQSARRIAKLGEDRWRIFRAGSPGLDDITQTAATRAQLAREFPRLQPRQFALVVFHPQSANEAAESRIAGALIDSIRKSGIPQTVIVYPNNDPGSAGIVKRWDALDGSSDLLLHRNLPRGVFLGLLQEAALLIGNSSSGIIEAASFGTPVIDLGERQAGRERGVNVIHVPRIGPEFDRALLKIWNNGSPRRASSNNPYGGGGADRKIAGTLAQLDLKPFARKLIAY